MSGLLRAELRRLASRRLARVVALAFLGILLLIQANGAVRSRQVDAAFRAEEAQARVQQRQNVAMCEADKANDRIPDEVDCEIYGDIFLDDPRYRADEVLPGVATGITVAAAIAAFVIGASFVGAEWHAGTMQALLFWEPRRQRVVLAKAVALVAGVLAFTVVAHAIGWATTMLVAATRGTTEGATAGLQQSAALTSLRGLVVVAFTGVLGFAVAGLARVTGAALGAAFVYFAILENLVRGLRPGWVRYLVTENVIAVVEKSLVVPSSAAHGFENFAQVSYTLTGTRAAVTLAVYAAALVGAFAVTFSRRDVT